MNLKEMNLKEMLLEEGIVKIKNKDEEPFTLKSGRKSRFFIDIKEASLNPGILNSIWWNIHIKLIDNGFIDDNNLLVFDNIASVAVGAVPIGTILSYKLHVPQIIVRSEKHDTGTKTQVIGKCKGKKVLLIEDVATSGGSIVSAVEAIRDAGGICDTCLVVVDREEGAERNCLENGINLYSLLRKSDFGIDLSED